MELFTRKYQTETEWYPFLDDPQQYNDRDMAEDVLRNVARTVALGQQLDELEKSLAFEKGFILKVMRCM